MKEFKIGDRVVAIKETNRRRRSVYIYGRGNIIAIEKPDKEAHGYTSQLAQKDGHVAYKIKLDENDRENDVIYSTECLILDENMFDEAYSNMYCTMASLQTDRYRYWQRMQREEKGKLS